jgi:lipopolysaccharide exporter
MDTNVGASQLPYTGRLLRACKQALTAGGVSKLLASAFARDLFTVMTGTAVAQAIGFALSPVISHLFSPADFGVFGAFSSVAGVIVAGATLEYTQAIMLPKQREDALNLVVVSVLSTAAIATLCLLFCLVAPGPIKGLLKTDSAWMLVMLGLATVTRGVNQTCQAWCVRVKAFKDTSVSQVVRSVSSSAGQIGMGLLRAGSLGLVLSNVLADLLASVNLVRVLFRDLRTLGHSLRWARMRALAAEYRDFPLYSATQNIINALSLGLPVLLLSHFFGLTVAGAYAFGMRILGTPMDFVLTALRQVLFQKACEADHHGQKLLPLYAKATLALFALAVVPSLVLLVWGPQIFSAIFGAPWRLAGEFARSLVLWLCFMFCNLPCVLFARIIRIQRRMFVFNLLLLAARTAALVLGGCYLSAVQTVMLFSGVGAVMNLAFIAVVGRAIAQRERKSGARPDLTPCPQA